MNNDAMLRVKMSKDKLHSLSGMAQRYGCNNMSDYVRMALDYFAQHQPPVVWLPNRDTTDRELNEKATR